MNIGKERMALIHDELEAIRKKHRGILKACDVVEAARDKDSAMHTWFEWNKAKAAEKYLLEQARTLIQMVVTIEPHTNVPIRPFVSLVTDRKVKGGGYRHVVDVMSHADMRESMLAQALLELEMVQSKYQTLLELSAVWTEINAAKAKRRKKAA